MDKVPSPGHSPPMSQPKAECPGDSDIGQGKGNMKVTDQYGKRVRYATNIASPVDMQLETVLYISL